MHSRVAYIHAEPSALCMLATAHYHMHVPELVDSSCINEAVSLVCLLGIVTGMCNEVG